MSNSSILKDKTEGGLKINQSMDSFFTLLDAWNHGVLLCADDMIELCTRAVDERKLHLCPPLLQRQVEVYIKLGIIKGHPSTY